VTESQRPRSAIATSVVGDERHGLETAGVFLALRRNGPGGGRFVTTAQQIAEELSYENLRLQVRVRELLRLQVRVRELEAALSQTPSP
jgi:hypothetical protein